MSGSEPDGKDVCVEGGLVQGLKAQEVRKACPQRGGRGWAVGAHTE